MGVPDHQGLGMTRGPAISAVSPGVPLREPSFMGSVFVSPNPKGEGNMC